MKEQSSKKLIEVALPLEAINRESAREKSIRHGHPSTLHLWWARRPLAACRAVLFASLVDDPSSHPDKFPTEEAQEKERQRLFRIIEELVKWENTTNEQVLEAAREEIRKSTGGNPPPVLDPFCGGGSIPLEAQRLGLKAYASDLNPVAVLITKALIEIPPKFAACPPVNPEARKKLDHSKVWRGAQGLAEDVRYYGRWMRGEAEKSIGHLYPKVKLPKEQGGGEATVIAWLWARTVKCPNPACGGQMPLVRSFWLSRKGQEQAWVEPVVSHAKKSANFRVTSGEGKPPSGTVNRRGTECIVCREPVSFDHIRAEGKAGRMSTRLIAIVAEGKKGIMHVSPDDSHEEKALSARPHWVPETDLPEKALGFRVQLYGMIKHSQLFTARQLVALTTFSDLVDEARERVLADAKLMEHLADERPLDGGGAGGTAYADAVATYLAFAVDRGANYWSSLTPWGGGFIVQTFGRQALPMVWDFAEANPFSSSTGNWVGAIEWIARCLTFSVPASRPAYAKQLDATAAVDGIPDPLIFTDPPYYDNIGYADLSDFFYVWLRRSVGKLYPQLFSTLLTPKEQELIATPYRFGGDREKADSFFEEGLATAFARMYGAQHQEYPLVLYYAFKQAETDQEGSEDDNTTAPMVSTGWETMLQGLLGAGFVITGTWPLRTEREQGLKTGTNVLASSIALVCRRRGKDAPLATRREFLTALKHELPVALRNLQHGSIAPVDLAQAAIGPGMAVFSRYAKVVEADGSPMSARTALGLINQTLDEVLAEQESEFDAGTRWALAWFEQFCMEEGPYGVAETLSKAKNTAINGLQEAGILAAKAGKVRLLRREELSSDWSPATDRRLTIWEVAQYLIQALDQKGEAGAAELLRKVGALGEVARDLAYRLYTICDRKGWAKEAVSYNALVVAWPEITRLARAEEPAEQQPRLNL